MWCRAWRKAYFAMDTQRIHRAMTVGRKKKKSMQQKDETARRVAYWLHNYLSELGYEVTGIEWQEHGLDAPVLVDGHHIGKLGQCYAESRDGELVARLRTSVTHTE